MADVAQNFESCSGDFYCRDRRIKIEPRTYTVARIHPSIWQKVFEHGRRLLSIYITRTYYAKRFVISLA